MRHYGNSMEVMRKFCLKSVVLWLIAIIGFYAAIGVYLSLNVPITTDEGIFTYQAGQILNGAIPFREIYTQAPMYLWLESIFLRILGYNLFASRMLSVCMNAISIVFVFLIGKELYSKRVGLLASAIFAFGPTIILHSMNVGYRPVSYSMVTIAMYLLVLAIKEDKAVYYGLFGGIFGIALWTYRGVAPYALICAILTLYICRSDLKNAAKNIGLMAGGGLVTFGLILCYLAANSSLEFINYAWGFAPASGSITKFMYSTRPEFSVIGRFSSVENFLRYFRFNSRVLYVISRDWLYLVIPSLLFIATVVRQKMTKHSRWFWLLFLGFSFTFIFVVARGMSGYPKGDYGTYEVALRYQVLFTLEFVALLSFGIVAILSTVRPQTHVKFADDFLIAWFMAVGVTLFLLSMMHAFYALSLAAVSSLMAGVILDGALDKMGTGKKGSKKYAARARHVTSFENWHNFVFILIFVLSMATIASSLASGLPVEFHTPLSTAKEIGEYIEAHTAPDEEVFTCPATFAIYSHRRIALDMPNFYVYRSELLLGAPLPREVDKYNAAPSIEQLLMHFKAGKIKYVVLGDPIGNALLQDIVELQVLINDFYEKDTDIGGFTIYRLSDRAVVGDFWDLCANLPSISAYSEKDLYTYSPGEKAFIEKPDYKLIMRTDLIKGSKVAGSLKTNQIQFHPPIEGGETSFIKFDIPHNQYRSLVTSYGIADEAVNLTQGVVYDIWVSTDCGNSYTQLLSTEVKENIWRTKTFDLTTYQEKDLTFLLSSRELGGDYYWLQITFRLSESSSEG